MRIRRLVRRGKKGFVLQAFTGFYRLSSREPSNSEIVPSTDLIASMNERSLVKICIQFSRLSKPQKVKEIELIKKNVSVILKNFIIRSHAWILTYIYTEITNPHMYTYKGVQNIYARAYIERFKHL